MACSRPTPMMDRSPATSSTLRMPCASKILAPIWAATIATSTAPGQSMEASPAARPVLRSAGVSAHIRDTAAMARGRLMKNTARQEKVMR